jgi:hypothetical protein
VLAPLPVLSLYGGFALDEQLKIPESVLVQVNDVIR